jgi:thioredoxin 2
MTEAIHLVCPHCMASNRLPKSRLNAGPKCGQCHNSLFNGHPIQLNSANFEKHLTVNDIPLVVDFWADWCGPCRIMAPAIEQAAGMLEPEFRLGKINTEAEPAISSQYAIRSIPTLIVFFNGQEQGRQAGAMNLNGIVQWVKTQHCKKVML